MYVTVGVVAVAAGAVAVAVVGVEVAVVVGGVGDTAAVAAEAYELLIAVVDRSVVVEEGTVEDSWP
jgi:hypothetical protein